MFCCYCCYCFVLFCLLSQDLAPGAENGQKAASCRVGGWRVDAGRSWTQAREEQIPRKETKSLASGDESRAERKPGFSGA